MEFMHAPAIWADFPQLVPGVLYVDHVRADQDVRNRLEPYAARARTRLATASEADLPEIQAWRRAFSRMGLKPTQYRSAAEALLRRFRKEDRLPTVHPLVDICNAVSLAAALPIAVIDLDQVTERIEVRYAVGDETYESFGGEVEHPEPNEVIFADAARQVHARRWTFRQSRRSTVSDTTRRALIVSEALHQDAATDITAVLADLETELTALGYQVSQREILTAAAPHWRLNDQG